MIDYDGGIYAVKPEFLRPTHINLRGIFGELSKIAVKIGGGAAAVSAGASMANPVAVVAGWNMIVNAVPDAVAAISNIGFTSSEGCAYTLVRKALLRAVADLGGENIALFAKTLVADSSYTAAEADDIELKLAPDFLRHPRNIDFVLGAREPLTQWLIANGMSNIQAWATAERLPVYFALRLHDELIQNPDAYEPLVRSLKNETAPIALEEWLWSRYRSELIREPDRPLFEQVFGLQGVFVPLRAKWTQRYRAEGKDVVTQHEGDVGTVLLEWLLNGEREDYLRVISGDPGSGKSSCSKMLAAKVSEDYPHIRVVYVPLHRFNYKGDLRENLKAFLSIETHIESDLLSFQCSETVVLFFDGLDELVMQGMTARQAASDFIRHVGSVLSNVNHNRRRVLVILGGRQLLIQDCSGELRKSYQILTLQGYDLRERFDWWVSYGRATGKGYNSIPSELNRDDLADLTKQPLLNYLLALSYDRKKLDFSRNVSTNAVYADLLDGIYDRAWGSGGNFHLRGQNATLSQPEFEEILQEIGVAVWHDDTRSATLSAIRERCRIAGLFDQLTNLEHEPDAGIFRLLTAFHVKFAEGREGSVEFSHKSFGEYLTARRIVRMISTIIDERKERKQTRSKGWDETYSLTRWAELCGPKSIGSTDLNLFTLISQEINLRHASRREEWSQILSELAFEMLSYRMPVHKCGLNSFAEMDTYARNAEEALLCALYACLPMNYPVREDSKFSATEVINRLRPNSVVGGRWRLDFACISALRSLGGAFACADLMAVDLERANLSGIDLRFANLRYAKLKDADLTGAVLSSANLENADLTGAILKDANLNEANLSGAKLDHCDLRGANLQTANMPGVSLQNAWLSEANFYRARLVDADLRNADLTTAIFSSADLRGAELTGTNSVGADLRGANLSGARLDLEKLMYARVNPGDLSEVVVDSPDLSTASEEPHFTDPFGGVDFAEPESGYLYNAERSYRDELVSPTPPERWVDPQDTFDDPFAP